jgi:hypothetical protein
MKIYSNERCARVNVKHSLITDEEYTSILQDSEGRVARLEGYDAAIKQVAAEARREMGDKIAVVFLALDIAKLGSTQALKEIRKIIREEEIDRLAALPASGQAASTCPSCGHRVHSGVSCLESDACGCGQ